MNEIARVRLMLGISAVVLLGSGLFLVLVEGLNLWSMAMFLALVAIALVAVALVMRALRDLKSGYPIQDERSRALSARAGFSAFFVSMYATLALAFVFILLEDRDITLPNSELLFIVVAMMGSVHLVLSTYLSRKRTRSSA
jgi:heme/copper-type cytochrome/quinol oxidase subunit 1